MAMLKKMLIKEVILFQEMKTVLWSSFPAFAQGDYEATVDGKPVELSNRTLWKIAKKKIKEAVDEYNEEMKDQKLKSKRKRRNSIS